ncbi:MAG: adenine phosphoribosyltransferase [Abditibacteriota bacterium]|nr:adenine phosphoribosyltransferase [Abditibacteriota bacterium]
MNNKDSIPEKIRIIPDFPRKGIGFLDICPLLADSEAFGGVIELMAEKAKGKGYTKIIGLEARGFVFSAPLALRLGCGLVLARKSGKLPGECVRGEYATEYSVTAIELQKGAIVPEDKVLIVDDIVATGGSLAAAQALVGSICSRCDALCFIDIIDVPKLHKCDYEALFEMKEAL